MVSKRRSAEKHAFKINQRNFYNRTIIWNLSALRWTLGSYVELIASSRVRFTAFNWRCLSIMRKACTVAYQPSIRYCCANYVLSKVLTLAALSFWLAFSARNYGSHRHNATLNRHRTNALQTFRSLAEAAKVEEACDVILKEAAAAIFGVHHTGYSKTGGAEATQITQVLPSVIRQAS